MYGPINSHHPMKKGTGESDPSTEIDDGDAPVSETKLGKHHCLYVVSDNVSNIDGHVTDRVTASVEINAP